MHFFGADTRKKFIDYVRGCMKFSVHSNFLR
jgi:hypothetical protein